MLRPSPTPPVEPPAGRTSPGRAALVVLALASAGCGGGTAPAGPPQMPPMPVEIVTLEAKSIEQIGEFVGTIKSRRSTRIQPQVEGFLTRIHVRSGDRVSPGTALMEIDATPQRAVVASLESVRAAREADAAYARQQAARARTLFEAGATSRQEFEQALAAETSAVAQLGAIEEQIRQQQAELAYYRVTAPVAGTVGDVPVREGDRVTRSTLLTTLDDNAGLEVYVSVPVHEAARLRTGLPLRIVDETGATLASERVSFVSPAVDEATQTVLVKAPLASTSGRFRTEQFVRVRLVWSTGPGITVPVVAVVRVNGQFFAFVAEGGERGLVARQRALTLGRVVGNEYVVAAGLSAGERLIVGGIQKIGDGAPVMAGPPPPPGGAPGGEGR